jgi:hypothetical protein
MLILRLVESGLYRVENIVEFLRHIAAFIAGAVDQIAVVTNADERGEGLA